MSIGEVHKLGNVKLCLWVSVISLFTKSFNQYFTLKIWIGCFILLSVAIAVEPLRFLAIGDWGDDDGNQEGVAATMGTWAASRNPEFVLSLGDNFYPDGVANVNDSQWDTKWRNVSQSLLFLFQ